MVQFRVFDISASGHRLALHESRGVFHVALGATRGMPLNQRICGRPPVLGPSTLHTSDSGQAVDLVFERTGCSLWEALDRLEAE